MNIKVLKTFKIFYSVQGSASGVTVFMPRNSSFLAFLLFCDIRQLEMLGLVCALLLSLF